MKLGKKPISLRSKYIASFQAFQFRNALQRASASIGANLAEGCGRETDADFKRFVQIATGSACEVEYHLVLARDLSLIEDSVYEDLNAKINEVKRMLVGLSRYLEPEKIPRRIPPR